MIRPTTLILMLTAASALLATEPFIPPVPDKQPEPPFPPTPPGAGVTMLVPGFTVRELPVRLTNLNNVEYAADGRLFAAGYDGRFHVLRDANGDGLEERVDTFVAETSENYPLGMAIKDGEPYAVLTDEVVRFRDMDGDGIPERRETVVKGFDDPELVTASYLVHRRVDSSMAIAHGPEGSLYITMGNSAPGNAYWTDAAGAHYGTAKRRGCLLKIHADGRVEQLATGLRYIMSLQWNAQGDLFGTDQEGATWVPNGNPFDELLHIETGRHYGFPPHHPKWLPEVVDEPSVWNYAPQHQSTCGFRFNGPAAGRGRFGPEFWAGDAVVTGEARGRLWRTALVKTAAGYVARSELIARLGMMPVDVAVSPTGDLVVCCHSGAPDWGNGPKGEGRVFKISYTGREVAQPVLAWPTSPTETTIVFDRKIGEGAWPWAGRVTGEAGRHADAADRLEQFRPGYEVVKRQQDEPNAVLGVSGARLGGDGSSVVVTSEPRQAAVRYALSFREGERAVDLAHDLSGLETTWRGADGGEWRGWLPHPDLAVARGLTTGSTSHAELWQRTAAAGTLTMRTQLDLWQMLIPVTQVISTLDYTPAPETVTVTFAADAGLELTVAGGKVERVSDKESRLTVAAMPQDRWLPATLTLATPATRLEVWFTTTRDGHRRALGVQRFLMPFATPPPPPGGPRAVPELAGGNWRAGHDLFVGKAACATCHQLRGEGQQVGPDLGNVMHRDYASVLKDIMEPSAAINPDAIGYTVTRKDGTAVTGTRVGETEKVLKIAQPGGVVVEIAKETVVKSEPLTASLMPAGLDKVLTPEELRDLMTYLLMPAPLPVK